MRTFAAITILCGLLTLSIWAKTPATKSEAVTAGAVKIVSASDLAALVKAQPAGENAFKAFIELAPYSVSMEHRIKGQGAAVHEKDAELFYIIDGSGTLVTGGKLVDEKRTNDANLSGTSIQGGTVKKVSKGDWVIVPEGVPHQFPTVEGLTMMSLHLPRK